MQVLKPHLSLDVRDIEASVAFYEKLFAVRASKRRPGYAKFDLQSPALNLAMMEARPSGRNVSHFGVQVASSADVLEAKRRLEAAGLATREEQDVTCCYAVQDKVWARDPDGNEWEFFFVKADTEAPAQATPQAATSCCSGTSCCDA